MPAYEDQPVGGRRRGGRFAGREGRHPSPAIASSRWPAATCDTWEQFYIAIGTRPNREVAIALLRDGQRADARRHAGAAPGQSRFEIGDIGVLPERAPARRVVITGRARREGRPEGRRRRAVASTASRSRSRYQLAGRDRQAPRTADRAVDPARRRSADDQRDAGARRGDQAAGSASRSATTP